MQTNLILLASCTADKGPLAYSLFKDPQADDDYLPFLLGELERIMTQGRPLTIHSCNQLIDIYFHVSPFLLVGFTRREIASRANIT